MVGSDIEKIETAVNNTINEKPLIQFDILNTTVNGSIITVQYKIEGETSDLLVHAALVQSSVYTNTKAGENRGVKLFNYNVVRDFVSGTVKEM